MSFFVFFERFLALRPKYVFPREGQAAESTVLGRILTFSQTATGASEVTAYAEWEMSRMERGLFVLGLIVNIAPMIGLLGTVVGLVQVFSNISPETGLPDSEVFVHGIALALSTTIWGLVIAIPAQIGNGYLSRRIETYLAEINISLARAM
ncbi:MAG: hypothetical protein A2Y14_01565 [Verrucomicrobia bacterium GWF2_51_19]|nr:MAG: hypothetical protein A2Y14_01565 [Verrucomicrobia bacterium GWF2_51_19]